MKCSYLSVFKPRLTDEYCDPVDLRNQLAESADLLGACALTLPIDDDYSVPYEVKKIVKGMCLSLFDVLPKFWPIYVFKKTFFLIIVRFNNFK